MLASTKYGVSASVSGTDLLLREARSSNGTGDCSAFYLVAHLEEVGRRASGQSCRVVGRAFVIPRCRCIRMLLVGMMCCFPKVNLPRPLLHEIESIHRRQSNQTSTLELYGTI